jgi:hypothetical protein
VALPAMFDPRRGLRRSQTAPNAVKAFRLDSWRLQAVALPGRVLVAYQAASERCQGFALDSSRSRQYFASIARRGLRGSQTAPNAVKAFRLDSSCVLASLGFRSPIPGHHYEKDH